MGVIGSGVNVTATHSAPKVRPHNSMGRSPMYLERTDSGLKARTIIPRLIPNQEMEDEGTSRQSSMASLIRFMSASSVLAWV